MLVLIEQGHLCITNCWLHDAYRSSMRRIVCQVSCLVAVNSRSVAFQFEFGAYALKQGNGQGSACMHTITKGCACVSTTW